MKSLITFLLEQHDDITSNWKISVVIDVSHMFLTKWQCWAIGIVVNLWIRHDREIETRFSFPIKLIKCKNPFKVNEGTEDTIIHLGLSSN